MKLLPKTTLIISMTLLVMLSVFYFFFSQILFKTYAELEAKEVKRDLERIIDAVDYEIQGFNELVTDWAQWDDSYQFVEDHNDDYINSNLNEESLTNIRANAVIFSNKQNEIVEARGYKMHEQEIISRNIDETLKHILAHPQLLQHSSVSSEIYGFVTLKNDILILASQPILQSDGSGPIRGTLLFGRFFNEALTNKLAQRLQLNVRYYRVESARHLKTLQPVFAALEADNPFFIKPKDDNFVYGFTFLRDIYGEPCLLVRLLAKRTIYQQGQQLVNSFLIALSVFGLIFIGVSLILLQRTVLSRLFGLVKDVQHITHSGDITARVQVVGKDELSTLSQEVNTMLVSLEEQSQALTLEKEKTEALLHNILPISIAERMRRGETMIAEHFDAVTVLFCDIVGFTQLAAGISPEALVDKLNKIFSEFDYIADRHALEKIKMIGDAYMVVGGVPERRDDHAEAVALMALEMRESLFKLSQTLNEKINVRMGMSSGEVVAGIIGMRKFAYDLWGDTVNTAARMESHGIAGKIHCTEKVYHYLRDKFEFEERGFIEVKGKGKMLTYFLVEKHKTC